MNFYKNRGKQEKNGIHKLIDQHMGGRDAFTLRITHLLGSKYAAIPIEKGVVREYILFKKNRFK